MLKQLQHKRFTMRNDKLSLPICHWSAQSDRSIEPAGSYNDGIHKRPGYIHV